jgi:predicted glycosyltransferase
MKPRILFYVQHLLGIGHVKRAAAITRAMSAIGLDVTVVLGGPPVPLADFGSAEVRQLPSARAADSSFKILVDEFDQPIDDEWRENRRQLLADLYADVNPDLFLIELFPFGRRQFRFELLPLLDSIAKKVPVVCSVREVLVGRVKPERDVVITEIVQEYFDHIYVHGDEAVIPLDETFPLVNQFIEKLSYTGYVTDGVPKNQIDDEGAGEVIVSTGSGAVGEHLLRESLAAISLCSAAHLKWRFLAGRYLPQSVFDELKSIAPENAVIEWARSDFREMLPNAALSISLGGYNTVMDVLSAGCPAVVVPFADGDEGEQTYRAREFAKRGLLHLLEADALSAPNLATIVDKALNGKTEKPAGINMSGAESTADLIKNLV